MPEVAETEAPITLRRAQTRERLMAAARTVFAERGVHGASVEEICEVAGFTRGAFYSNFADKSELVLAMIQHRVTTQYAAAERAVATMKAAGDKSAEELVAIALSAFESGDRETPGALADQELLLHAAREPTVRLHYLAFLDQCRRQLAALISDALHHTGLEFTIPLDHAIELLAATHDHLELLAVFHGGHKDSTVFHSLLGAITRPVR